MDGESSTQSRADDGSTVEPYLYQRYVLGFCFGRTLRTVVLIRKVFPPWQARRLNGLGGHVEAGETPLEGVAREFREESGCDEALDWASFGRLRGRGFEVHLFCSRFGRDYFHPHAGREGVVDLHLVSTVLSDGAPEGSRPVPNLRWLLPMAANFLRGEEEKFLEVEEVSPPAAKYF